jgi:hypothetical protein
MTYVKCAGCGSMVQIPDELAGELRDDVTHELTELYYCDACEERNEDYYPFEELY